MFENQPIPDCRFCGIIICGHRFPRIYVITIKASNFYVTGKKFWKKILEKKSRTFLNSYSRESPKFLSSDQSSIVSAKEVRFSATHLSIAVGLCLFPEKVICKELCYTISNALKF
ncbi:hypothetical protein ACFX1X_042562 [Malus domestica]